MSTTSAWLAQLESEPWYQKVAAQFQSRGIADPLWQSTLYVEDSSLDPTVSKMDHFADGSPAGYSTGLFQLNANGVGAGYSTSTLQDPVANATIAAQRMAQQIQKEGTGSATLSAQLQSIERAGWNGSLAQDPKRQQALASVASAENVPTSQVFAQNPAQQAISGWLTGGASGGSIGKTVDPVAPGGSAGADPFGLAGFADTLRVLAAEAFLGAVFLAIVAGGFAIAAQGDR